MKSKGFGHLKTRLFTIKTSKHVGKMEVPINLHTSSRRSAKHSNAHSSNGHICSPWRKLQRPVLKRLEKLSEVKNAAIFWPPKNRGKKMEISWVIFLAWKIKDFIGFPPTGKWSSQASEKKGWRTVFALFVYFVGKNNLTCKVDSGTGCDH